MNRDLDFYSAIDLVEILHDWTYQETEGRHTMRFDDRNYSLWLHDNGEAEGHAPIDVLEGLESLGWNVRYLDIF